MRWRLMLFFMAVTGAFCFVLLTSVTDYTTTGSRLPLIAAGQPISTRMLSSSLNTAPAQAPQTPAPARTRSQERFDPMLKPAPARFFVARDADPVWERHELEKQIAKAKALPKRQSKLKYDDTGWYREENALVTAYCPCAKCCGTQSPGITSTGKNAWTTGLAADPLKLAYGTRVLVEGYGFSVVDDTGGAMRRHWRRDGILHIDVRMTYHYEARQWGKRYMRVKIYENE